MLIEIVLATIGAATVAVWLMKMLLKIAEVKEVR